MTLDTTIPVWSVISFLFPLMAALIWSVITQHFNQKGLERRLDDAQKDIEGLESAVNNEIKTIQQNINEINSGLRELNNNVKLLIEGKIVTNAKP
jgi:peptidoglycan hydrolase CwlO-like protein